MQCEIEPDKPLTKTEKALLCAFFLWPFLLIYAIGHICCGCVNCYTRCPGTKAKVVDVYQCTRTAAAGAVVVALPQLMNDCGDNGLEPLNLLTVPLGLCVLADAVCEAAVDTVCLPADIPLHFCRKGER